MNTHYRKLAVASLLFIGLCAVLLLTNVTTPALAVSPLAEDPQPEPTAHLAGVSQAATVTITDTTDAFSEGQTLEDRSVFPQQNASAPVVTASGDAQDARISTIEVRATYRASSSGNSEGTFYTKEETIETKQIDGIAGTVETAVDIGSVFATKNRLEEEFGNGVTVTPRIESVVTYQYSSVNGRTQTNTVSVGGDIIALGELYSLPGGSEQSRHDTGPPATDPTSPLVNASIAVVGLGFILLFGATVLIGYRSDPEELVRRIQAKRYDEWVTEIKSYTPSGEPIVVQVHTMAGLVNLAIDIHERVLYTSKLEEYIVMDGSTMYKYRPEDSDRDGGSEFFGFNEAEEIPDMPEFDANGNPITAPSSNGNDSSSQADPEAETDSEPVAESDV